MKNILFQISFISALFCAIGYAQAPAKIDERLLGEWQSLAPGHSVSAIAYLTVQVDIQSLDRTLSLQHASRADRHRIVVDELRHVAAESQGNLQNELELGRLSGDVAGFTAYWIVNAIVIEARREYLELLATRPDIQWIGENFRPSLIEPVGPPRRSALDENEGVPNGIRAIGASRVWYELGITGAGRIVGNIDTGVDGTHPALAARWRGLTSPSAECWLDVVGAPSQFPYDEDLHGTHVMGTICGNSTITNDSIGVAPGARWIACNAVGLNSGGGFNNAVFSAFQWMSDPDGNSNTLEDVPDVVQNSWGVDGRFSGYEDCFELWNNAIVNCEAAGVVVTYSAGNEGPTSRTLRSPATKEIDSVTVFSIGAVDAENDTILPYVIADFSSRGPSDCVPLNAIKPEVCAPGVDIYSSFPNGSYGRLDGTSMAGPHVAGIVALMREANPNAEVREIKSILMRTAIDHGPAGEDNDYGFGFVNAFEAVTQISANRAIIEGVVTDANSGEPILQARVSAGERFTRQTNSQGFYRLSVIGDTIWNVRASAYGYADSFADVDIDAGDTIVQNFSLTPVPQGTIIGHIIAGESVPVSGATVSFVNTPLPARQTDVNGNFAANIPGDSTYTVRVAFDGAQRDTSFFVPVGETINVTLRLTNIRSEPEGPDPYGYRAYDRLDYTLPPNYDWMEIAPRRGGSGTVLSFQDRDSSAFVALPFPFRYYGLEYDSLTVNENGWVAGGVSHDHSFFNFAIPSQSGPPSMLALFWDNLHLNPDSSQICFYHDSENCRVIIEYFDVRFIPATDSRLTCQLQIYSADARPAPTGDSEILFLYERIDLPGSATIGIENPTETIGVQIVYNGTYSARSWTIQSGSAVLFTTQSLPRETGSLAGSIATHPPLTDYRAAQITVGCDRINPIQNGSYAVPTVFTGTRAVRVTLPGHESLTSQIRIGPDSASALNFELWRLDPPRQLQGANIEGHAELSWLPPESVAEDLDEFRQYIVYRDGDSIASVTAETFSETLPGLDIYRYYVTASYDGGASDTSNHVLIDGSVGVGEQPSNLPREFALGHPYPNPFNASTALTIALPTASRVLIVAFDVLGREAAVVTHGAYPAGIHRVNWNPSALPSGVYILRMEAGNHMFNVKALLLK